MVARRGLRLEDLYVSDQLAERVREAAELHNFLLENYYHAPRIDVAKMLNKLCLSVAAGWWRPRL